MTLSLLVGSDTSSVLALKNFLQSQFHNKDLAILNFKVLLGY